MSWTDSLFKGSVDEDENLPELVDEAENCTYDNELQLESLPVPKKSDIYSLSGDLMQALQTVAPSVKTCSVCSESFQTKATKNSKNTIFRDVHLQAKRILGKILPNILSKRDLDKKAVQWLTPKLSFSFLRCLDHKKQIV